MPFIVRLSFNCCENDVIREIYDGQHLNVYPEINYLLNYIHYQLINSRSCENLIILKCKRYFLPPHETL